MGSHSMLRFLPTAALLLGITLAAFTQASTGTTKDEQEILSLVARYARARETGDSKLLRSLLTQDVDQLVSSGEWRRGVEEALKGMRRSSSSRPGSRRLTVERVRFLTPGSAVADARYEIESPDGSVRRMWSTFIVVQGDTEWRIAAIRNMLPAG